MLRIVADKLFSMGRGPKRIVQVGFDIFAIATCFWLAMVLRLDGIRTTPSRSLRNAHEPVTILLVTLARSWTNQAFVQTLARLRNPADAFGWYTRHQRVI